MRPEAAASLRVAAPAGRLLRSGSLTMLSIASPRRRALHPPRWRRQRSPRGFLDRLLAGFGCGQATGGRVPRMTALPSLAFGLNSIRSVPVTLRPPLNGCPPSPVPRSHAIMPACRLARVGKAARAPRLMAAMSGRPSRGSSFTRGPSTSSSRVQVCTLYRFLTISSAMARRRPAICQALRAPKTSASALSAPAPATRPVSRATAPWAMALSCSRLRP